MATWFSLPRDHGLGGWGEEEVWLGDPTLRGRTHCTRLGPVCLCVTCMCVCVYAGDTLDTGEQEDFPGKESDDPFNSQAVVHSGIGIAVLPFYNSSLRSAHSI